MSGVETATLVVAGVEFVALVVATVLLIRARRGTRDLQDQLDSLRSAGRMGAAGRAVKAVLDSAVRVRDQGLGGFLTSSLEELTRMSNADRAEITKVAAADGTVTIVFSDIEDSTALNEQLGDAAWVRLLSAHDAVVRRQVSRHAGHVVKSQGDGFMVVFGEPAEAIAAAIDIQRAFRNGTDRRLRRVPIRVRMGAHVGSAIERDGDYFGRNVALAARVAAHAGGGEIVVSSDVAERLDGAFALVSRGSVELKGFNGSHDLWAVDWDAA